ncbi:phage tail protein [Neisseria musculi]|uniref:Phage Tail Collar domain protein n=1 Tax=Neisseria musculi TaxID=1815583 RepID=A0A7H1M8U3_9NEIS|nr:tail fiber protein [Neisseria musculi]QNT58058.1 phage Tail Collar domain protein [Neisseria musculi]
MLSGNQTVGGTKTFAARADFAQGLRFSGAGKDQPAALGMGGSDVYLHNPQSNKYLQLKDDGTLAYSNDTILLGSHLSSAVNLADTARPASAAAAKTAYDRGSAALQTAAQAAPAGTVAYFAGHTPPAGWLKANGAQVSRTVYAALFAAISTTYGAGNGSTTFTLPDLRGVFPRGVDDGRGIDSGRGLGTYQPHRLAEHRHATGWRHGTTGNEFALIRSEWAGLHNVTADAASNNVAVNYGHQENYTHAAGSSYAHSNDRYATSRAYYDVQAETRPTNVALLACIKI